MGKADRHHHHAWTSGYTLGFLAASVVLGAAFVWWEERHRAPMVPLVFFRNRWSTVPALGLPVVAWRHWDIYLMTQYFSRTCGDGRRCSPGPRACR
ncbi:MAG: hypothetical protein U0Y82_12180 [Thermoleophilia bacterium]